MPYPTLCKGCFTSRGETGHIFEDPVSLDASRLVPALARAGVTALKIEGRQRSRAYVAEVVRDLYRSERQPEQSYSERQLFEQALDRMAREIAAVKKIDDDQAVKELEEYLSKNAKRAPAGEKTEDDVAAYCKEQLTGYKRPKHIEFREDLPMSNVGKILRKDLRDEELAMMAKRKKAA